MSSRDKSEKFVELANKRVTRVLKDIQLVANLANKQNYEYTEEQGKKIVKAMQAELDALKQSFSSAVEVSRGDFKL